MQKNILNHLLIKNMGSLFCTPGKLTTSHCIIFEGCGIKWYMFYLDIGLLEHFKIFKSEAYQTVTLFDTFKMLMTIGTEPSLTFLSYCVQNILQTFILDLAIRKG